MLLFTAVVTLSFCLSTFSYVPIIEAEYYKYLVDFGDLEEYTSDIIEISLEDFSSVRGVRHSQCKEYRDKCKDFIKCTTKCDELLIPIKELEKAIFIVRDEDYVEGKTNACIAMYAFCIPAPYRILNSTLDISSAYDY